MALQNCQELLQHQDRLNYACQKKKKKKKDQSLISGGRNFPALERNCPACRWNSLQQENENAVNTANLKRKELCNMATKG